MGNGILRIKEDKSLELDSSMKVFAMSDAYLKKHKSSKLNITPSVTHRLGLLRSKTQLTLVLNKMEVISNTRSIGFKKA
jgi:hypothetical protein